LVAAARRGGKRVGYIRVSSADQNTGRQLEGLQLDKTFTDKASGKDVKRPQLQAALELPERWGRPGRSFDGPPLSEP